MLNRMRVLTMRSTHKLRWIGIIAAIGLAVTACGTPNVFTEGSSTNSTVESHDTASSHQPTIHMAVLPKAVNSKVLPKKTSLPLIRKGSQGADALLINEALASLHYLPVQFQPNQDVSPAFEALLASDLDYGIAKPPAGSWTWRASYPQALEQLWNPNTDNVITEGAVMAYERDHGMPVDGVAGPEVTAALSRDLRDGVVDTHPYINVTVSKSLPERLTIWSDGKAIYSSLANTGVAAAPTPDGTYPVYARFRSQTMSGTNPDGTKYSDPGVPWINYFYGGDAIHGFVRNSYGFPQSVGCVELPVSHAQTVFGIIDYGTLVTVTG